MLEEFLLVYVVFVVVILDVHYIWLRIFLHLMLVSIKSSGSKLLSLAFALKM